VFVHPNILQAAIEEVCHTDWSEWPKGDGHHFLLFCTLLERTPAHCFCRQQVSFCSCRG
jgi:hypothetical protein